MPSPALPLATVNAAGARGGNAADNCHAHGLVLVDNYSPVAIIWPTSRTGASLPVRIAGPACTVRGAWPLCELNSHLPATAGPGRRGDVSVSAVAHPALCSFCRRLGPSPPPFPAHLTGPPGNVFRSSHCVLILEMISPLVCVRLRLLVRPPGPTRAGRTQGAEASRGGSQACNPSP